MSLKRLESLLAEWRAIESQEIALDNLRTDPALQPRAPECVGFAQANAEERRTHDHVAVMAARFRKPSAEVEPVLALQADSELFIVDGHHRLEACRLAGRRTIPARILSVDWPTAVAASKLVNLGGEKMTMHQSQRADAAWQLLTRETNRGRAELPAGTSQRSIAERFGIAVGTVNRMVQRLREQSIDPARFDPEHLDPGTGWPRWQHARRVDYGKKWTPPSPDEVLERDAAKVSRAIAEAHARHGMEVLRRATTGLREHGMDAEALYEWETFLQEIEPDDADY